MAEEYTRVKDGYLEVRKKLYSKGVLSSTGKSLILLTSGGFQPVEGEDGVAISLTVVKKQKRGW